jgi:hypothetical protein
MIKKKRLIINVRAKERIIEDSIEAVIDVTKSPEKRGSIAGAVSLIIGTSIGSGILAIPEKTSPAVRLIFINLVKEIERPNYQFSYSSNF